MNWSLITVALILSGSPSLTGFKLNESVDIIAKQTTEKHDVVISCNHGLRHIKIRQWQRREMI